jgi:hypothetical protein
MQPKIRVHLRKGSSCYGDQIRKFVLDRLLAYLFFIFIPGISKEYISKQKHNPALQLAALLQP